MPYLLHDSKELCFLTHVQGRHNNSKAHQFPNPNNGHGKYLKSFHLDATCSKVAIINASTHPVALQTSNIRNFRLGVLRIHIVYSENPVKSLIGADSLADPAVLDLCKTPHIPHALWDYLRLRPRPENLPVPELSAYTNYCTHTLTSHFRSQQATTPCPNIWQPLHPLPYLM